MFLLHFIDKHRKNIEVYSFEKNTMYFIIVKYFRAIENSTGNYNLCMLEIYLGSVSSFESF